ncbi:30S ribosomal protein S3 [Candidatus Woesearchaeota archaeon]|nr:30S ribosomal protein S3 [Candidatus Woesearchaeota archaeon]
MIEREFVAQRIKEFRIHEFVVESLKNAGISETKMLRTPLGEKILIATSKPGLVVGKKGQNISKLTRSLKKRFKLDNPQVELTEVDSPELNANIVAERIASSLERFGSKRFKAVMHKAMEDAINAGAVGVEIRLSGKVPSARARSWRVYSGYIKKCGDVAVEKVRRSYFVAKLKSGVIGIKVSIMPPGVVLPDSIRILEVRKESNEQVQPQSSQSNVPAKEEVQPVKEAQVGDDERKGA